MPGIAVASPQTDPEVFTLDKLLKFEEGGVEMSTQMPEEWMVAAVVVLALALVAWLIAREQRRKKSILLRQRFGPEYTRLVAEHGSQAKAEAEMRARERRVDRLKIVPLLPTDAARFSQAWGQLQSQFVDNPTGVVVEADRLVRDLMIKRGYPMADFEHRAADISVHHPTVVDAYRAARDIAARSQRGNANTEDLRKAVVYYRTLFDELLEVRNPAAAPAQAPVAAERAAARNEVAHT
jgi:hypothetical protein